VSYLLLGSVLLCVLASSLTAAQNKRPTAARPVNAISAIINAFRTYDVVTLGEGPHGNERGHRFRLSLVRDRRFLETVDDVLVEFGTGRYQAVMDRFINGEAIPYHTLRRVWEDTTAADPTWERPIYREFFETIRAVNAASPKRRIRVLLGDAPIDWAAVKTRDDLRRWGILKTRHATDVIKREVLAKRRKVLVIFGDSHLQGRGFPGDSMTTVLERQTKVFAISASSTDLAAIQPPRWTGQNRPFVDTSKPAISGWRPRPVSSTSFPRRYANPSALSCASSVVRISARARDEAGDRGAP
jgi:hypothetical protein